MVRTGWNVIPELNGGTRRIEGSTRWVEGGRAGSKADALGQRRSQQVLLPAYLASALYDIVSAVRNANRPVVVTIQAHRRNEFHLLDTPLPPRIISRVTRMGR